MKKTKALNYIPGGILNASDYELLAPQFIPPDYFGYISGGSGVDKTLRLNRNAFEEYSIIPRVLCDLDQATTQIELLGQRLEHPLMLSPLAYQTLAHPEGEKATAAAAEATDTLMVASTLSSFSMEEIARRAGARKWFQLYLQPDFKDTLELIRRAKACGYRAIVLTVDAAVQLPSRTAINAGFNMPADLYPANLSRQTTDRASVSNNPSRSIFHAYAQNSINKESLKRVMEATDLPVLVKGVLHAEDAVALKQLGVSGIIVSNHGGRTLDGVPASLSMLTEIRQAVGSHFPLLFDSGIRSGQDAFKAIALGADAVLIGRLQVYALGVAGALGVAHMLKLLRQELELTMSVAGTSSIRDIQAVSLKKG